MSRNVREHAPYSSRSSRRESVPEEMRVAATAYTGLVPMESRALAATSEIDDALMRSPVASLGFWLAVAAIPLAVPGGFWPTLTSDISNGKVHGNGTLDLEHQP